MRTAYFAFLLTATLINGVFAQPAQPALMHKTAVDLARDGDHDQALDILAELREQDPANRALLYDETVILAWAGDADRTLDNARHIDVTIAPDYVLRTVAATAREAGEYATAIAWYSAMLDRDADDVDARAGLAMSHADAENFFEARETIAAANEQQHGSLDLVLASAYVNERQGRLMRALADYQAALQIAPGNRVALRGKSLVLRAILLPKQALAVATEHPGILSGEEIVQLEADVVALRIRHGAQSAYPDERRHEGTDRALSEIEVLLARPDLEANMRKRLRYDRIVSLADRLRMGEAIADFEALAEDVHDTPAYVLEAAGRAYLYERKPERAREVLEIAGAREPNNLAVQFPLFFVYADLADHRRALALAESLLDRIPPVNQVKGSPIVKPSRDYLRAAIMAGLARAYADQLADSQEYFETLLAEAPHNTDLRQELANVYRWRGWLNRSLSEYAQVLAVEPDLMSARVGRAHARLDSRDYVVVEHEVETLREHHSDLSAVKNLDARWRVHQKSELDLSGEVGESSGPTFGEDQYRVDARWRSRPIAHRYRILLGTHDAFAEFPEGDARRRRLGAGLEYRYQRWLASATLSGDRSGGRTGFRGSVDYRLNDFWSLGGSVDTNSDETPLRGARVGISSDMLAFRVEYARHESTGIAANFRLQDFSDGNAARSLYVAARHRLLTVPRYKLTLLGELFAEERDRDDVPYFSPLESIGWAAGLRNDWTMLKRYDFALVHRLTGMAGRYDQSGFAAGDTWSLDYELVADLSRRWSTRIGVRRRGNVYDGQKESSTFYLFGFRGRF